MSLEIKSGTGKESLKALSKWASKDGNFSGAIWTLCSFLFLLWICYIFVSWSQSCKEKGGVLTNTIGGYTCLERNIIK